MVLLMTFAITAINVGLSPDFLMRRVLDFEVAYPITTLVIYFQAPSARKLTARFVELL